MEAYKHSILYQQYMQINLQKTTFHVTVCFILSSPEGLVYLYQTRWLSIAAEKAPGWSSPLVTLGVLI